MVSIDDMSPLDDRLDRIVDHYVKTLNELAKLPPLGEEWSDLDRQASEGEVEFTTKSANENDIFQRIHDRCSEFIESGASQKLADQCTIFWEEFWSLIINKVTEAGSLPDNNISSWKPGVEDDSLLVRIKNNKSDAEAYLELAPCISDVKDSIHDIPPFSEINWRDLRNDFEHHNWEKNWKNDNHLITFYSEPGYLRWEWSDYRDAVEKCLRVVSGDFSKSKSSLLTRRAKKSSELSAKARYSSDMLKAQIEALEWSPADYYINPQDSGDQVQELANLLHSQSIVQLVGTGGLGKTALAYKFILENLSGGMEFTDRSPHEPISPFFPVIFLTSKDWPQGEFDATHYRDLDLSELEDDDPDNPRNPHNPKIGAGEFYSGDFDSFTHNVSTLNDSSWGKSPKDTAYQVIAQQNVLVVLDNFEDVLEGQGQSENEELKKYLAFFNQFTNPRGRIILTTRELVEGMRGTPLELLPVSNRARFELMKNRFLFLSVEHGLPAHPKTALFFTEGTTEQRTKAFNSLAEEIGENFRENLRYPHVIFMFTRELMEAVNSRSISLRPGWTFEDAVRAVATREDEDGYSFAKLVERHWEWSILKSFNSVKNSELCLDILKLLWERNRGMSMQDIIGQIGRPIGEIRESINRLMIHGVFLDKNTSDSKAGPAKILETDSFKLKAGARGTLGKLREFKGLLTRSNPEPISNAQRSDLDIIKQLQTEIEAPTGPANKSRIAELLGKLVNPPQGVSISGRRPINENVVRRAFEVLQDIDSKYPEEGGGWRQIKEDIILSSLKRNFERILLEASLTLSNKETADNSFFIGTSLWVLERRLRHGSLPDRFNSIPSTIEQKYSGFKTLEAEMAFNVGLVRDAICDLSGPIIEEVETGIPPSWAPALVRLLSDDRLCPIQASLSSPQSFPTTTFLVDEEENPISVDINYASKWIDICCSLEHQNLVTDWNAKQKLVDIFGRFVMWHLDIISHSLKPRDIARRFHSTPSPLTEIPGTLNKLVKFLFDNRRFLEPSNGNTWLLVMSNSITDNPNWKANPAGLQKWDTITLSDSEIVNIKEHFNDWNMNFSTSSLLHPLGGRKKITEKSLAPGVYHVTAVDPLTQSISLHSYTELQDTKSEKPTESIPLEEIREWVELEIRQEDGFITLEELANRWLSTRGISFNKALKPHGHKASSLMELIVIEREDLYSVFDNSVTKSGLKLRVLKQGEDRETLDAIATTRNSIQVTNRSNKWLTNWPIPDEPEKIWDMMREVSAELRSIPTEKWEEHASQSGKLEFRWAQRFRRLIFVQATHNDNWSRKTHHTDVRGTPSDISPHGLLNNMVGAMLAASKKDVEIDHKFISDYLDDLRESVLALSDEPHNPIDSWNLIEEKSQLQRPNLSEHARSHIKQQERRWAWKKRVAKFGPVVSSPNLISDYLFAFSETPKSKDEFLACAKKAYSRRIKSSRTRYVGIRKSDEYVWKFWGIGTEKGLTLKETMVLLLMEAGLSEDEIARLLERSLLVNWPVTEEE